MKQWNVWEEVGMSRSPFCPDSTEKPFERDLGRIRKCDLLGCFGTFAKDPEAFHLFLKEVSKAKGMDSRFDSYLANTIQGIESGHLTQQFTVRILTERLALLLQGHCCYSTENLLYVAYLLKNISLQRDTWHMARVLIIPPLT